jgi:hypothetical protein
VSALYSLWPEERTFAIFFGTPFSRYGLLAPLSFFLKAELPADGDIYSPGDNFDTKSSHVIPALMGKFAAAKDKGEKKVVAWRSGKASREFMYVADAARGIRLAAIFYLSEVIGPRFFEIGLKSLLPDGHRIH